MADTPPVPTAPTEKTQFAVLLFTDICDSTGLKAKHGAMAYKAAAELHNALVERLAAEEHLTLIKNTGDGYFARTTSVAAAVRFALCLQYHLRTMPWPSFPLTTRVGIHAGEVADITTLGQADVLAPAADLVARVMSLAVGGQILLTRGPFDEARHFVRNHAAMGGAELPALMWLAHGPYLFKGCDEPVEVFEVGLTGHAPLVAPPDGEKARRALRPGDEETLGWRPADGLEIPGRPGWRLTEKLGAGGFGEVWAGERDKTRERRAFKFCFDAERLRALKREVTLTRLLRETLGERDDIVRIYDLRLDEPPYFLESELAIEGNLLQWAEKQGGLAAIPLADRIELVAATATALAAAHSIGVLHKDIKPTNVLIFTGKDGRPRPRLVDFGIGTVTDTGVLAQHGITGAGFTRATLQHSSGTPTYSPPEYVAGRPFTVQGDVFSLGVMLWQLVTAKADAPLAEGWQRDVPDELLREDIATCVDGDPGRRFPSAADLSTRLRELPARRQAIAHEIERRVMEEKALRTAEAERLFAEEKSRREEAERLQHEAEASRNRAQRLTRIAVMLATTTAALVLASAAFVWYELLASRRGLERNMTVLADAIGHNCAAILIANSPEDAEKTLHAFMVEPSVLAACIYTADGSLYARHVRDGEKGSFPNKPAADGARAEGNHLVVFRPIRLYDQRIGDQRIGTIYIEASYEEMYARMRLYVWIAVIIVVVFLLLGITFGSGLNAFLSRVGKRVGRADKVKRLLTEEGSRREELERLQRDPEASGPRERRPARISAILATTTAALALVCAAFVGYERLALREGMARNMAVLADAIGRNCAAALSFADHEYAEETLQALAAEPSVRAACVRSAEGSIFATFPTTRGETIFPIKPAADGTHTEVNGLVIIRPVLLNDTRIGTIYVEASFEELNARLRSYPAIPVGILSVILFLGIKFRTRFCTPMSRMR